MAPLPLCGSPDTHRLQRVEIERFPLIPGALFKTALRGIDPAAIDGTVVLGRV
jgi:hypothetical protein